MFFPFPEKWKVLLVSSSFPPCPVLGQAVLRGISPQYTQPTNVTTILVRGGLIQITGLNKRVSLHGNGCRCGWEFEGQEVSPGSVQP